MVDERGRPIWTRLEVRAFLKVEDNIRLAHSAPITLPGKWDARADAECFRYWIDGLIAQRRDHALTPNYPEHESATRAKNSPSA